MTRKIVFLDVKTVGNVPNLDLLGQFGLPEYYQTTTPGEVNERVKDAHIVITNKVVLNKVAIEQASQLELICVAATGTNNVDKVTAARLGIPVMNVANYSSNGVAQGTFALLLHLTNQVAYFDHYVKSGEYAKSDIFTNLDRTCRELSGKRFGIIGLGSIGRKVAKLALAFGAEVVYYSASGQTYQDPYQRLELDEFLGSCDVVSIHAPLNEQTANLITLDRLKRMKPSAILINAGRGGIVKEADLARALDQDLIAGAAIDVFEKEPVSTDNPLLKVKQPGKLVMTPHSIWASIEARTLLIEKVAANIQAFVNEKRT